MTTPAPPSAPKPTVLVAAAALIDVDGRVLICRRPQGKSLAGLWEFPGGKYRPLPWRLLTWDDKAQAYVADLTKDRFKDLPAYDRDQLNSTSYGWAAQVERFFEGV